MKIVFKQTFTYVICLRKGSLHLLVSGGGVFSFGGKCSVFATCVTEWSSVQSLQDNLQLLGNLLGCGKNRLVALGFKGAVSGEALCCLCVLLVVCTASSMALCDCGLGCRRESDRFPSAKAAFLR